MTRRIELVAFYLLIAAAVLLVLWTMRWWRSRGGGAFCPGKRRPWSGWLFPWKWLIAGTCGYDLRGTPAGADGTLTCSECGRRHPDLTRAWRKPHRLRLGTVALVFIALAFAGYSVRPVRRGDWTAYVPTPVLLLSQQLLGGWSSRHGRDELESRLDRGELSRRSRLRLAKAAVGALASDSGHRACWWGDSCLRTLGDEAIPMIEAGLDAADTQERQMCASILRDRADGFWRYSDVGPMPRYGPTPRLLEVTVEGLADDAWAWPIANATEGYYFLIPHADAAAEYLRRAMSSTDFQQRLLAAAVAGHGRVDRLAELAAPILMANLDDDEIDQNAILAAGALFDYGEPARQEVEQAAAGATDRQRKAISQLILLEWEGAATTDEARDRRRRRYGLTLTPFEVIRAGEVPDYSITGFRAASQSAMGE